MSSQGKIELYQLRQHQGIGTISVELDDAGLRIANGKTISWGSSHNVNLNRVDTTEYQIAHFLCRIETDEGSFKFLANIDEPLELKQYHAFVYDLHQRLAKFKSNAVFTTGMNSQTAFRAMVLGGITMAILLEALVGWAVYTKGKLAFGLTMMVIVAICTVYYLVICNRQLKPRRYDPLSIPPNVLP